MYVITFANPKGGSGKTTSAMLLAEQIALSGGRVSILDLDPNANILAWSEGRQAVGRGAARLMRNRPECPYLSDFSSKISCVEGRALLRSAPLDSGSPPTIPRSRIVTPPPRPASSPRRPARPAARTGPPVPAPRDRAESNDGERPARSPRRRQRRTCAR